MIRSIWKRVAGTPCQPPDQVPEAPDWRWRYRSSPSALIVTEEIKGALGRQHSYLTELDTKASFVGAAAVAVLAAAAVFGKWPSNSHAQDAAGAALGLVAVALASAAYTWWPRRVGAVPEPREMAKFWRAYEESVHKALTDARIVEYERNRSVERRKTIGLRIGIVALPFAIALGFIALLIQGQ